MSQCFVKPWQMGLGTPSPALNFARLRAVVPTHSSSSTSEQIRIAYWMFVNVWECPRAFHSPLLWVFCAAMLSRSVLSDPWQTPWTVACQLLCPRDSPGKNTGVGCHALLQRIFPIQGLNPRLLHCRQILYHLSHQESPWNHNYDSYTGTIVVVQSLSQVPLHVTTWTAAHQAFLSFTISQSLLKLMCIELMIPSNHLSLCHPLLFLPSIFPSIRDFSSEWALGIRWPKDWSFNFSTSPSNEYSQLISFRFDWLDLHTVQGSLKSLLQHHRSKASILWHLAFFMVQLSHPYMTTRKTIALTRLLSAK